MHSGDNNTLFTAWSEAERQARDAERQLYEQVLTQAGRPACREDVDRVRGLRDRASELLAELLAGLRDEASVLRTGRSEPASTAPSALASGDPSLPLPGPSGAISALVAGAALNGHAHAAAARDDLSA